MRFFDTTTITWLIAPLKVSHPAARDFLSRKTSLYEYMSEPSNPCQVRFTSENPSAYREDQRAG